MYLGKMMEIAPSEELYANPVHPYTTGPPVGHTHPRSARSRRPGSHKVLRGRRPQPRGPALGVRVPPAVLQCPARVLPGHSPHGEPRWHSRGRVLLPAGPRWPEPRCYTERCSPGSRGEASTFGSGRSSRKVRTPQSRVLDNVQQGKPSGKCHRNDTARRGAVRRPGCNGEMVR